jgi:hypothetical protein
VNVLSLFDTLGGIFGPLMFLAAIVAIILCLRATLKPAARERRRLALYVAFSPLAVGICAAVVGLAIFLPGGMNDEQWRNLGKAALAGLVMTAIPLVWCLTLFRRPHAVA